MKRISIVVLILCVCCASVAWGQQPTCGVYTPWAQFHRYNMRRSNPCEKVLNVQQRIRAERQHRRQALELRHRQPCVFLDRGGEWRSYATGSYVWSSPAVANGVVYVGSNTGKRIRAGRQERCQALELHYGPGCCTFR
jgi:hypothetical protein